VIRLVLSRAAMMAAAGLAIEPALSLAVSRLIGAMLFGLKATDPVTYANGSAVGGWHRDSGSGWTGVACFAHRSDGGAPAGISILVAMLACHIPARRAANLKPTAALRQEYIHAEVGRRSYWITAQSKPRLPEA
jgi:hypothetical protein